MGAIESRIAESAHWFVGEDRALLFNVIDDGGAPQTMTDWSLTFELLDHREGTVLIEKTSETDEGITIGDGAGTDDRATVVISDTDTDDDDDQTPTPLEAGTYFYVLRRTDSGSEAVLAFGDAVLQRASI